MAQTVSILPPAPLDRERLLATIADRNRARKHVQRAEIILLSAERLPVAEIARRAGVSHSIAVAAASVSISACIHRRCAGPGTCRIALAIC